MELEVNSIEQIEMAQKHISPKCHVDLTVHIHRHTKIETLKKTFIDKIKENKNKPDEIFNEINTHIKNNLLSIDYIKQNFESPRFVNFCWSYILCKLSRNKIISIFNDCNSLTEDWFIERRLSKKPFSRSDYNLDQRKASLIKSIQHSNSTLDEKINFVDYFKSAWGLSLYSRDEFKWLNRKPEYIEWVYEYLKNHTEIRIPFTPTQTSEKYWAFVAALELETNKDLAELAILKLKKSFSQMKYREKNKEMKFYSIGMTSDTKEKLDKIVKHKDTKIHKVIEQLIDSEHRKTFS